jgi:hypothetical protein
MKPRLQVYATLDVCYPAKFLHGGHAFFVGRRFIIDLQKTTSVKAVRIAGRHVLHWAVPQANNCFEVQVGKVVRVSAYFLVNAVEIRVANRVRSILDTNKHAVRMHDPSTLELHDSTFLLDALGVDRFQR